MFILGFLGSLICNGSTQEIIKHGDIKNLLQTGEFDKVKQAISKAHEDKNTDLIALVRSTVKEIRSNLDDIVNRLNPNYGKPIEVTPAFQWAQTHDFLYLFIKFSSRWNAPGALYLEDLDIQFSPTQFSFSGLGSHSNNTYKFLLTIPVFDVINPDQCKYSTGAVGKLNITLAKSTPRNWPSLWVTKKKEIASSTVHHTLQEKYNKDMSSLTKVNESVLSCSVKQKMYNSISDTCVSNCETGMRLYCENICKENEFCLANCVAQQPWIQKICAKYENYISSNNECSNENESCNDLRISKVIESCNNECSSKVMHSPAFEKCMKSCGIFYETDCYISHLNKEHTNLCSSSFETKDLFKLKTTVSCTPSGQDLIDCKLKLGETNSWINTHILKFSLYWLDAENINKKKLKINDVGELIHDAPIYDQSTKVTIPIKGSIPKYSRINDQLTLALCSKSKDDIFCIPTYTNSTGSSLPGPNECHWVKGPLFTGELVLQGNLFCSYDHTEISSYAKSLMKHRGTEYIIYFVTIKDSKIVKKSYIDQNSQGTFNIKKSPDTDDTHMACFLIRNGIESENYFLLELPNKNNEL